MLYSVSTVDKEADRRQSQLWEVSWDGSQTIPLTSGHDNFSEARWSPDGKYISFLSTRSGPAKGTQIWVLDRRGGEARQLTALKGRIRSYAWSPDASQIALVFHEGGSDDSESEGGGRGGRQAAAGEAGHEQQKPFVEDRYAFKRDGGLGYIADDDHARIYFYSLATGKVYPNQNHGFTSERFIRDRYERYVAWYDRFLKGTASPAASQGAGRQ